MPPVDPNSAAAGQKLRRLAASTTYNLKSLGEGYARRITCETAGTVTITSDGSGETGVAVNMQAGWTLDHVCVNIVTGAGFAGFYQT